MTPKVALVHAARGTPASRPAAINAIIATMRSTLTNFGPLPGSLSGGSGRIAGTAFFPGGDGLVRPRAHDALPDVLVIGHDFGTLAYFETCVSAGAERTSQPTWRGILRRLADAGIDAQRCLFTNAFVGYRKEGGNTDDFPARKDHDYTTRCQNFVAQQIDLVRPRAIVALGKHVPSFLSALSPDLPWSAARDFAQIDRSGPLVHGARFGDHRVAVCALVHPSFGHLNVGRRQYRAAKGKEFTGIDAEVAMLRDVTAAERDP